MYNNTVFDRKFPLSKKYNWISDNYRFFLPQRDSVNSVVVPEKISIESSQTKKKEKHNHTFTTAAAIGVTALAAGGIYLCMKKRGDKFKKAADEAKKAMEETKKLAKEQADEAAKAKKEAEKAAEEARKTTEEARKATEHSADVRDESASVYLARILEDQNEQIARNEDLIRQLNGEADPNALVKVKTLLEKFGINTEIVDMDLLNFLDKNWINESTLRKDATILPKALLIHAKKLLNKKKKESAQIFYDKALKVFLSTNISSDSTKIAKLRQQLFALKKTLSE